jgi:hypothetical protein
LEGPLQKGRKKFCLAEKIMHSQKKNPFYSFISFFLSFIFWLVKASLGSVTVKNKK